MSRTSLASESSGVAPAGSVDLCVWASDSVLNEVVRLLAMSPGVRSSSGMTDTEAVATRNAQRATRNAQRATRTYTEILVRRVSDVRALVRARLDGISRLSIDLGALATGVSQLPSSDLMRALERWRRGSIVMIARPENKCIRFVHAISSAVPSELHLLGVDTAEGLREALRIDGRDRRETSMVDVLAAIANWPGSVQEAVTLSLGAPRDWPIKRIAAHAGISRRSLERYFGEAGLPGPAKVLRRHGPDYRR